MHLGEALPPLVVCLGYTLAYLTRTRTLRHRDRPVALWRQASFVAGIVLVTAVQLPPLDDLADRVLVAHMLQHLVIGDLASFLVVLGLTGPVLQPLLQRALAALATTANPSRARAGAVGSGLLRLAPAAALPARPAPRPRPRARARLLLLVRPLLWLALLGPLPKPRWFNNWARLGYVVAVRFLGAALANAFIWASTVFYPYYEGRDELNPVSDQNVAGAIMMLEQIVLTTLLLAWLFHRAATQDEQSQQLLDLAEDRGVALSEERARRAASGGAAERLRTQLLSRPSEHPEGGRDGHPGQGGTSAATRRDQGT